MNRDTMTHACSTGKQFGMKKLEKKNRHISYSITLWNEDLVQCK